MKKTTLLLLLIAFGLKSHSQDIKQIEDRLKKNQDEKKIVDTEILKLNNNISELNLLTNSDSIKTIIYNFKTKKYEQSNVKPKVGEPLIFKIVNINRLAYNINITSTDVAIADVYFNPEIKKAAEKDESAQAKIETPPIINVSKPTIDEHSFKDLKAKNFTVETEKIDKLNLKIKSTRTLIDGFNELDRITTRLKEIKDDTTKAEENEVLQNRKISLLKLTNSTTLIEQETILKSLESERNNFVNLELIVKSEIEDTFEKLNTAYHNLSKSSHELNKIRTEYKNFRVFALNPLLNKYEYDKAKINLKFLENIKSSQDTINHFEKAIIEFYYEYNLAINNWRVLDQLNLEVRENIRNRYQTIKLLTDEINRNIDTKELSTQLCRAVAIDNVLTNEKAYEMSSAPIQPQEDYVTFEIDIKNRDDKSQYEYNDERKFVYMEYTQGGVRFDFSTGVVFDFWNQTSNYELKDVGNSNKQIIATTNNNFTPTLAGMFHTSFRRNGIWAFGLTLGASLNVETFQLNSLFPGLSLLIGKKQKFVITVGPAFKLVDTLKANYETNTDYNQNNFTANSSLTSSQFKIGGFFGLTYNLTNGQKGTFKISDK